MQVFFYGLFMDRDLLAAKGIRPKKSETAVLEDYQLKIGERATLMQQSQARTFGILMELAPDDVAALYSDASVADYVLEAVIVTLAGGRKMDAACYNLPPEKVKGANEEYASKLYALAQKLGFPDDYLKVIKRK